MQPIEQRNTVGGRNIGDEENFLHVHMQHAVAILKFLDGIIAVFWLVLDSQDRHS